MNPVLRVVLQILGIGVLVAGGLVVALAALVAATLFGTLVFWLAWNVLDFAAAVGLPELGFWGIVLVALFLVVSWFGKVVITAIVFLAEPSWFDGAAEVRWPSRRSATSWLSRCSPCSRATARPSAPTHRSPR